MQSCDILGTRSARALLAHGPGDRQGIPIFTSHVCRTRCHARCGFGFTFLLLSPPRLRAGLCPRVGRGGGFVNQNKAKFVSSAAARAANGEVKVGKGGAAVFMHRSARAFLARSPGDRQGIPWRGFLPSDTLFLRKDFLNRLGWRARISYVPTCFAI